MAKTDTLTTAAALSYLPNMSRISFKGFHVKSQRALLALVIAFLSVPAYGDSAKDAYKRGERAEKQADYDTAYADYKQAYLASPSTPKYFNSYTRIRFNAANQHIRAGQSLLTAGALNEALAQFRRAAEMDGTSSLAKQEVRSTEELIHRQERQQTPIKIEPPLGKVPDDAGKAVELQPLSNAPMTIHITATADVAYKTIGKLAGLNVVIDPDLRAQKITLDLKDVTLREALDMVRLESKTIWAPVLPNTIAVAADSPEKHKELEQNVMRTFYLKNVTTSNELQDAANVLKQILDVNHIQLLQAQDAMILRGTPDQLALAGKLLEDIDKPKSEVMIDVTVMQVSRNRIKTLGTNVPTSATVALAPSFYGGTGSSTSSGSGGGTTGAIPIGSFLVSVPSASFSLLASDSNTKILQTPRVRALNNEKATLRIGDRVPIATGSFQPGSSVGLNPLVSTQFTYLDVGVNVDITPHVHSGNEVTLKMSLEISSVTGQQTIGDITQPVIGQRRIEHEARLVDGEVNLIGGILEDSETKSLSGYPWLSQIPLLKYMFAQENKQRQENEIVFAITPHIVRGRDVNEENRRLIRIGTGSSIELRAQSPAPPPAVETSKSIDRTKPSDAVKPASAPKPTEVAKPVEVPKPAEAPRPAALVKPVDVAKPASAPVAWVRLPDTAKSGTVVSSGDTVRPATAATAVSVLSSADAAGLAVAPKPAIISKSSDLPKTSTVVNFPDVPKMIDAIESEEGTTLVNALKPFDPSAPAFTVTPASATEPPSKSRF